MSMTKRRHQGFTLVEVIIFIVVVAAGMAGILSVMNTVVKSSADPLVRKQALAIADSIMEEIQQKAFADPDGVSGEILRSTMDDVLDYNGATQTLFNSASPGGWPAALDGYSLAIAVVNDTTVIGTLASPARQITVTVSRGNESVALVGYRGNY
jgi:MSHA pilin protein MshD